MVPDDGSAPQGWREEVARIAMTDQAEAGMAQFAVMLRSYHQDLLAAGFTRAEALHLTSQYQTAIVSGPTRSKPQGDI